MKIIQTPVRFPPYTGGVEQHTYYLSKKLVERGHDVTVICARDDEQTKRRENYDGIKVIRLDYIKKIAQTNLTPKLPYELYKEVQDADIVHTHLPTPWSADVSTLLSKITSTPTILTYHNDIRGDGNISYVANLYNNTVMRLTLSLVDEIITTQQSYFEKSNIPRAFENKTTTITNGVSVDKFEISEPDAVDQHNVGFKQNKINLFFLSVLDKYHEYKGLGNLLNSLKFAPSNIQLVVGGDGDRRQYYEQMANDLGVDDKVHFSGYIPENVLADYYNYADWFILPSKSSEQEGFGLVALESLACGTPVITTEVVGVADDIQQNNFGHVISDPTPSSLSTVLSTAAQDTGFFHPQDARSYCINRYSWEQVAREVETEYKKYV